MVYCRDPALPFLEDKFHAKVLANQLGIPAVPMLFHCMDPKPLENFIKTNIKRLPDIVVKTNHGSGDVCILRKIDPDTWHLQRKGLKETGRIEILSKKLVAFMHTQLHTIHSRKEWAVNMIWPRRILIEPFIEANDDYKVIVSGGKAVFTYCTTGRFSEQGLATGVFDREWRFRGALKRSINRHGKARAEQLLKDHFTKPSNLLSLYRSAEILTPRHLNMQRVDFYKTSDGRFLLGEINSYSGGGTDMMSLENNAEQELTKLVTDRSSSIAYLNVGKVILLAKRDNEDENDKQALKRAYLSTIKGADIIVHVDASTSRHDISELIQKQRERPCSLQKKDGSWSWDKHYILATIEKHINDKLLVIENK
jgi:hypothetical protein